MFRVEQVTKECVEWIKQWFENNGKDCNAIIGISGGKDSSVVAALCVEALGKNRVIGIKMPNGIQADIEDANKLIEHLGITFFECNIRYIEKEFFNIFPDILNVSEQSKINLPPRIRMSLLYFISQSLNGRVANTCNLSENYVGYSTRWGDTVGDFSPLANLTSEEVIQIGIYLGLPKSLCEKVPSDGLCGKTDEDNLGFTYSDLNKVIRKVKENEVTSKVKELIRQKHFKNRFKEQPIPTFMPTTLLGTSWL